MSWALYEKTDGVGCNPVEILKAAKERIAALQVPCGAICDVAAERARQKAIEGWTPEHDDTHGSGEMALAAGCYALNAAPERFADGIVPIFWPWSREWWKPKDRRRDLVRAAALIVAEIERLDRQEAAKAA